MTCFQKYFHLANNKYKSPESVTTSRYSPPAPSEHPPSWEKNVCFKVYLITVRFLPQKLKSREEEKQLSKIQLTNHPRSRQCPPCRTALLPRGWHCPNTHPCGISTLSTSSQDTAAHGPRHHELKCSLCLKTIVKTRRWQGTTWRQCKGSSEFTESNLSSHSSRLSLWLW